MTLTNAQQAAVDHIEGNLQIIACAGAGKTEVISRRIANILQKKQEIKPENIVAFTFTEKAASALKNRIEKVSANAIDGMYIGTIHGFCKQLLGRYVEKFAEFKVLDEVKNHLFISRYADHCGMTALELKPCVLNNKLFLQCIDKLIDDYDNREKWTDLHQSVLKQYVDCLYSHRYLDFSLLIFEALRQIETNASVQAYLKEIKYLVVDEYQDVNDLQEKLIRAIADLGANVCVVGDDDQTIYQFRGSSAEHMISFAERYPNVQQVRLEDNFRCQKEIVDIAANIIGHNERRLLKRMLSGAKEMESAIQAKGYSNEEAEFAAIADQIDALHQSGVPYKRIVVLVRKGKHTVPAAKALEAKQIPYSADSAEAFFNGNYFSRFAETLRILENIDKAALYDLWKGFADGTQFNVGFKFLRSCARGGSNRLSDILQGFCEKIDFLNKNVSDLKERKEDLDGICKVLDDYDEIYGDYQLSARVMGLLRFLDTQAKQEYKYHNFRESSAEEDAVQILTVHKSKGLEFHTVFLPRLNKREFPVAKMGGRRYYHVLGGTFADKKEKYESDIEDERKLFYVAVTRAEQNLFLSYTLENQPVSDFVSNAAESAALEINREDLRYQPLKATRASVKSAWEKEPISDELREQRESERAERRAEQEARRELVHYAREALYDYYGTGNHFCPGIIMEFKDICRQGPEAILSAAANLGLI